MKKILMIVMLVALGLFANDRDDIITGFNEDTDGSYLYFIQGDTIVVLINYTGSVNTANLGLDELKSNEYWPVLVGFKSILKVKYAMVRTLTNRSKVILFE